VKTGDVSLSSKPQGDAVVTIERMVLGLSHDLLVELLLAIGQRLRDAALRRAE
jgi:hypothetical protein